MSQECKAVAKWSASGEWTTQGWFWHPAHPGRTIFQTVFKRGRKKSLDDLSNSVRPFDYMVKAGQSARPDTKEFETKE